MTSPASYDQALLDEAPEVSAKQKQRFYDPELLYDKPARTSKDKLEAPAAAAPPAHSDIEAGHGPVRTNGTAAPLLATKKQPFYRTRKGIIIIAVVLLVIIAAAVGGGVGGSQANKNSTPKTGAGVAPVSSETGGGGGAGVGTEPTTTSGSGGVGVSGGPPAATPAAPETPLAAPTPSAGAGAGTDSAGPDGAGTNVAVDVLGSASQAGARIGSNVERA